MNLEFENEEQRRAYYKKRIALMKEEKERELRRRRRFQRGVKRLLFPSLAFLMLMILIMVVVSNRGKNQEEEDHIVFEETSAENNGELNVSEKNETEANPSNQVALKNDTVKEGADFQNEETVTPVFANPVPHIAEEILTAQGRGRTLKAAEKDYHFEKGSDTGYIAQTEDMQSSYAILINPNEKTIVAEKDAYTRINPASMTKILTLLVAVEHLREDQLTDSVTITIDDTDYAYSNDCSAVGFAKEETVTVQDLLYGTILPSGGDAASALSKYVAGSREEFVDLMNQKLEDLGIADTAHFTNSVGLYDKEHYCTLYDMAIIMNAAIDNELCKEVMTAHKYTTTATTEHPEGITISNWFLRRIEDKDTHGEVICAKTGFVNESGSCAASFQIDQKGVPYICVTADAHSGWRCIYDQVHIYQTYTG